MSAPDARAEDMDSPAVFVDQPFDILAAGGACSGTSGTYSSVSCLSIRGASECLPDRLPVAGPGVLAGTMTRCELLSGQLPDLSGPEVPLPTPGSDETRRVGSPMGSGGYGPPGHVCHDPEGQPLCTGDCALFFQMDGDLSVA